MSQRALHTHNVPRHTVAHIYARTNKMKFDTFIQHMLRILARFVRCLPATASVTRYAHRRATVASTANACGTASAAGVSAGSSMRGGQCRRSHSNGRFPFFVSLLQLQTTVLPSVRILCAVWLWLPRALCQQHKHTNTQTNKVPFATAPSLASLLYLNRPLSKNKLKAAKQSTMLPCASNPPSSHSATCLFSAPTALY